MNNDALSWLNEEKEFVKCKSCLGGHLTTRIPQTFFYKHLIFWRSYRNYLCDTCGKTKHLDSSLWPKGTKKEPDH